MRIAVFLLCLTLLARVASQEPEYERPVYGQLDTSHLQGIGLSGRQPFGDAVPGDSFDRQELDTEINFSAESGFHAFPFSLELSCDDTIYFTLNGNEPTLLSKRYNGPIEIDAPTSSAYSTIPTNPIKYSDEDYYQREFAWTLPDEEPEKGFVIRARSFRNGSPSSRIYTKVYFSDDLNYSVPLVSIVSDSLSLFSVDSGIYVPGVYLDPQDPVWTGNYHQSGRQWERHAHMHFFDAAGIAVIDQQIGIRIHGMASRVTPQKSLRLYARSEYGNSVFDYEFFDRREFSEYKRLILRSSYTYWWGRNTLFQDDLIHAFLAAEIPGLDVQMTRPAVVFLNGEYWGVQNLRERQDEHYLESVHGVDDDHVDIVQGNLVADEGTADAYLELLDFIEGHDLSVPQHYEQLLDYIDIQNYIDYLIIQIYFGNIDWPANNMKMWKAHEEGSRWRWLVYDLDATFFSPSENSFRRLYDADYPALFFREILESREFRKAFIDRFAYHLNYTFTPEKIFPLIDAFRSTYMLETEKHISRWGNPETFTAWNESVEFLYAYSEERPCFIKYQMIDFFDLDSLDFNCDLPVENRKVHVFPNPCNSKFRISIEQEDLFQGTLIIQDMSGKKVRELRLYDNVQEIDVRNLSEGMYNLLILANGATMNEKLIIIR